MGNATRGEIEIEFGASENGTPIKRKMKLDANAICQAEEIFDASLVYTVKRRENFGRFSVVRALLWAGLARFNPTLTIDEVGDIYSDEIGENKDRIAYFWDKIMEALSVSMPDIFGTAKGGKTAPLEAAASGAQSAAS